jgi:hypothetical protein
VGYHDGRPNLFIPTGFSPGNLSETGVDAVTLSTLKGKNQWQIQN